jgi:hypothetical protein
MTLVQLNILGAGLLAFQALFMLLVAIVKEGRSYYKALFSLWFIFIVLASLLAYVFVQLQIRLPLQWDLALDTVSTFVLALAAYTLFRAESFDWSDKSFGVAFVLFLAYEVMLIVFGIEIDQSTLFWKVIYTSPSMLAASAAFLAVGVGIVRDSIAGSLRWPLLVIFVVYAILQPPGYYFEFIFSGVDAPERYILRLFNAVAKFVLFIAIAVAALSLLEERLTKAIMNGIRLGVWILSVGFGLFVFFYRFLSFLHP